jgi:hypothetical protein
MTCPATYAARRLHLSATGSLDFDTSGNQTPFYGSAKPIFRSARRDGKLPTLVLSHKMRQDAFQMDHDKALRGNRARAGRIAQEALAATNRILAKGVCSDAKHG